MQAVNYKDKVSACANFLTHYLKCKTRISLRIIKALNLW